MSHVNVRARRGLVAGALLSLTALGCSDGDAPVTVDAPAAARDAAIDAPPVECGISTASFGDLGTLPGGASFQGGSTPMVGLVDVVIDLESAARPDRFVLDLWSGKAPFGTDANPAPLVAGTYPLTGSQLQFADCGTCVSIGANWGDRPPLDHVYMATGGTLEITTLDARPGGAIAFTLTDVTFAHVRLDGNFHSTPANDGCVTEIAKLSYTGTFGSSVAAPPPAPQGAFGARLR